MLAIKNIPSEIYETAIEHENMESWGLKRAKEAYNSQAEQRGFTDGGLEKAISEYLTRQGNFDEENGCYSDVNGWEFD